MKHAYCGALFFLYSVGRMRFVEILVDIGVTCDLFSHPYKRTLDPLTVTFLQVSVAQHLVEMLLNQVLEKTSTTSTSTMGRGLDTTRYEVSLQKSIVKPNV